MTPLLFLAALAAEPAPITLAVDATDVPRRILHVRQTIPVAPGPVVLHYPKWIPGTHAPIGPAVDLVGLRFTAAGKPVAWSRDDADPHSFRLDPAGAAEIAAEFDVLIGGEKGSLLRHLCLTSGRLAVINWNELILYPAGGEPLKRPVRASIALPAGWKYATALTTTAAGGAAIEFAPVSLETLVDSPLHAGQFTREIALGREPGTHRVFLSCDSPAGLDVSAETVAGWNRLIDETDALFGGRHYRKYTFLLALSDAIAHGGLEHHESSDNRLAERALVKTGPRKLSAGLLPHELTHSWNGKHRRPADMVVANFQTPHRTRLLWVYEGLTSYLDWVLTARAGLLSADDGRDDLGLTAARMAARPGRAWRPLDDTAAASHLLFNARGAWASYRRSIDYYDEGTLIWLEVDTTLRRESNGAKSLDDFCRGFHGGGGGPSVRPFTFDDIVTALNAVVPYDWRELLTRRVSLPAEDAPLEGVRLGGWMLTDAEEPTELFRHAEERNQTVDLVRSVGVSLDDKGSVIDVVRGSAGDRAKLAPGMRLIAVDGRRYSADAIKDAVRRVGTAELLVENGEFIKPHRLETAGLKYPRLKRYDAEPDRIGDILKPRAVAR